MTLFAPSRVRLALLACVALSLVACLGSDGTADPLDGPDAGGEGWSLQGDAGTTGGGSVDSGGGAIDPGEPGPIRRDCTGLFPPHPDSCSPVVETSCDDAPDGAVCQVVAVQTGDGIDLALGCSRPNQGSGELGASCVSSSDCIDGLTCGAWGYGPVPFSEPRCVQICELASGEGCSDDEICTPWIPPYSPQPERLGGFGACTPRCDPYDAEACSEGQTCSIDYHYPHQSCQPEFRCLHISGAGGVEGAACEPDDATKMCRRGLVCLANSCVKPCQSDDDCGERSCGPPTTDFGLRYCR